VKISIDKWYGFQLKFGMVFNRYIHYAKHTGISSSKLQYWIRKFNAQEAGENTNLKFINLSSFDTADHYSKALEPQSNPQITLTFPNGMCLKIY